MNHRKGNGPDLLALQRALVKPLLVPSSLGDAATRTVVEALGSDAFSALLVQHGLAPLWFDALAGSAHPPACMAALLPVLKEHRTRCIVTSQAQRAVAIHTQQALADAGVQSVVFKGTQLANTLYPDPGLRPSADIDLLIAKTDQAAAVRTLDALGAAFIPHDNTICYQTALHLKQVELDLHWGFVRPGRTRVELAEVLLQGAEQQAGLRVPNPLGTLLALLIHPLASTRPNAPDAKLVRLIDLAYWLDAHQPDWDALIPALERAGSRHTAWLMLTWLDALSEHQRDIPIPAGLVPPAGKQRRLKRWLLSARSADTLLAPLAVQLGFRTALHSRPSDTLRELTELTRAKLRSRAQMHAFRSLLSPDRAAH